MPDELPSLDSVLSNLGQTKPTAEIKSISVSGNDPGTVSLFLTGSGPNIDSVKSLLIEYHAIDQDAAAALTSMNENGVQIEIWRNIQRDHAAEVAAKFMAIGATVEIR